MHTTDGGKNWEVVSSNSDLTRVSFYENQGWAIGLAGAVMHSSDEGQTWKDQISGNAFELFGVGFTSEQRGYIVGSNATLLETKNAGSKWHMVNDPRDEGHGTATRIVFDDPMTSWKSALGFYNLHFPTSTHGWGVGEMGKIAVTTDGGENWYGQSTNNPQIDFNNLFGVHFVSETTGWVVGAGGSVAKTIDAGKTWFAQYSGPEELRAVFAVDVNTGWIVGSDGAIYHTADGGSSWSRQVAPVKATLTGVVFSDSIMGWISGDDGTLLHTQDGGVTWLQQESPTTNNLADITLSKSGNVWAVGESGTILRY